MRYQMVYLEEFARLCLQWLRRRNLVRKTRPLCLMCRSKTASTRLVKDCDQRLLNGWWIDGTSKSRQILFPLYKPPLNYLGSHVWWEESRGIIPYPTASSVFDFYYNADVSVLFVASNRMCILLLQDQTAWNSWEASIKICKDVSLHLKSVQAVEVCTRRGASVKSAPAARDSGASTE